MDVNSDAVLADLREVVAFLCGEGGLDGRQYGCPTPLIDGVFRPYWWRKPLTERMAALEAAWNRRATPASDAAVGDGLVQAAAAARVWIGSHALGPVGTRVHADLCAALSARTAAPADGLDLALARIRIDQLKDQLAACEGALERAYAAAAPAEQVVGEDAAAFMPLARKLAERYIERMGESPHVLGARTEMLNHLLFQVATENPAARLAPIAPDARSVVPEPPPVDNAFVAPGCEQFDQPAIVVPWKQGDGNEWRWAGYSIELCGGYPEPYYTARKGDDSLGDFDRLREAKAACEADAREKYAFLFTAPTPLARSVDGLSGEEREALEQAEWLVRDLPDFNPVRRSLALTRRLAGAKVQDGGE